jgi:hypothetical protein
MSDFSICFIGNSHVGAWKRAWTNAEPPVRNGYAATFFASPGDRWRDLRLEGGVLVPGNEKLRSNLEKNSGGRDRIVCADYDAFVLIGLDSFLEMLGLCRSYGTLEHRAWVPITHLVTEQCLQAAIMGRLERTSVLFKSIRTAFPGPIFISPRPFPSEAVLAMPEFGRYQQAARTNYSTCLVKTYKSALNAMAARYDAEVLWQDDSTLRYPGYTRQEFADGAVRLAGDDRPYGPDNRGHMNEAFGALLLDQLLRRLKERSAAHAALTASVAVA